MLLSAEQPTGPRGISVETNAHIDLEPVQKQQVGGTPGVESEVSKPGMRPIEKK